MKLKRVKKIDNEWKEVLKEKWWSTNYEGDKSKFIDNQIKIFK